jgi:hypothetical protein
VKILVTGQYRSGSTWLFNAVRLIANSVEHHESVFYSSGVSYDYPSLICKTHAYYPELISVFDKIIVSTRPTNHVIESMKVLEKRGVEEQFHNAGNHHDIDLFVQWNEQWQQHADYIMNYDDMMKDKASVIKQLSDVLEVNCDTDNILHELDKLKSPLTGFDPVTFMTSTHFKFH